MKIDVYSLEDAKAVETISLDEAIFGVKEVRKDIIHQAVRWQLAKRRAGTRKTQVRDEVSRTTKKAFRQKGTGLARRGARNAGLLVGGSVAHGPKVRSHEHKFPKRLRKTALAHTISTKVNEGNLIIIDNTEVTTHKTKDLNQKLNNLNLDNALIIDTSINNNFARASSNIPNIDVIPAKGLNVYDILRRDKLVLTKEAVQNVVDRFDETKPAQDSPFSKENFVDDVRFIDGAGPRAVRALRRAKLGTLTAFTSASDEVRDTALTTAGIAEKAKSQDWLGQAKAMMDGVAPASRKLRNYAARILAKRSQQEVVNHG